MGGRGGLDGGEGACDRRCRGDVGVRADIISDNVFVACLLKQRWFG